MGLGIADVIAAGLVYQRSLTQNATANSSCNPSTGDPEAPVSATTDSRKETRAQSLVGEDWLVAV